jgi:tether containing UBX domain for GLUT4
MRSQRRRRIPPDSDLPDSYFTPTTADLKAAQSTLAARTSALVNAPLRLRATREVNEKAKRERWPNVCALSRYRFPLTNQPCIWFETTIRIRFTDRTQLEKVFPSTDKIRSVYAFVRSSLREDVKPIKFILCMPCLLGNSILWHNPYQIKHLLNEISKSPTQMSEIWL